MGTTYRKIWQGPADSANCHPLTIEGISTAAVRPGALCVNSRSNLDESALGATVFTQEPIVALEQGSQYGATIDTAWDIGDTVIAGRARSGELYLVLVAAGENITSTEMPMVSNGDGTLKISLVTTGEKILFRSQQIINVTGTAQLVSMTKEL